MVEAGNPSVGTGERVWMCEKDVILLTAKDIDTFRRKKVLTWRESLVGAGLAIVSLLLLFSLLWMIFFR